MLPLTCLDPAQGPPPANELLLVPITGRPRRARWRNGPWLLAALLVAITVTIYAMLFRLVGEGGPALLATVLLLLPAAPLLAGGRRP